MREREKMEREREREREAKIIRYIGKRKKSEKY